MYKNDCWLSILEIFHIRLDLKDHVMKSTELNYKVEIFMWALVQKFSLSTQLLTFTLNAPKCRIPGVQNFYFYIMRVISSSFRQSNHLGMIGMLNLWKEITFDYRQCKRDCPKLYEIIQCVISLQRLFHGSSLTLVVSWKIINESHLILSRTSLKLPSKL